MDASSLIVEVRDKSLNRKGIVLTNDLDVEVIALHNNVGSWKLTLPAEHPLCAEMRTPGSGLIVTDGSDVILSGPTVSPEFAATPGDISGMVTFTGVGDTVVLADALAWPEPTNSNAGTQATSHDERTASAETLMHAYVKANIGPDAPIARRKVALTMGADLGRGATLTKKARFPILGELLTEIAATSNLGFRVVQRGPVLAFETYEVRDVSSTVRLSLMNGELSGQKVTTNAPSVTRAIVAGSGQQVNRKFIERSNAASLEAEADWDRRIEVFIDQRQTGVLAELERAGDEVLAEGGATIVGVQAIPSTDSSNRLGRDWFLGDRLTVEVDGVEVTMNAAGLVIKADEGGFQYGVQLGDQAAFTPDVTRTLAGVETRVSALERNEGPLDGSFAYYSNFLIRGSATAAVPHATAAPGAIGRWVTAIATTPDITQDISAGSGGGRFTVNKSGLYSYTVTHTFGSNATGGRWVRMLVNSEASAVDHLGAPGSPAFGSTVRLSGEMWFNAGDNFAFELIQSSGAALSTYYAASVAAGSSVRIRRVV